MRASCCFISQLSLNNVYDPIRNHHNTERLVARLEQGLRKKNTPLLWGLVCNANVKLLN